VHSIDLAPSRSTSHETVETVTPKINSVDIVPGIGKRSLELLFKFSPKIKKADASQFLQYIKNGDLANVTSLLEKIPQDILEEEVIPLRKKSTDMSKTGMTPVILACSVGSVPILELLLEHKFPVNAVDLKNKTGLHYAIENKHEDVVMYLCDLPEVDVATVDNEGNNCFHYLAKTPATSNSSQIIKVLLERGAAINERNSKGETPVFLSMVNGKKVISM
jgi:ankyrin repeat protein